MKENCVVCGKGVSQDVIVCSSCAKDLGYPRQRSEEFTFSFNMKRGR